VPEFCETGQIITGGKSNGVWGCQISFAVRKGELRYREFGRGQGAKSGNDAVFPILSRTTMAVSWGMEFLVAIVRTNKWGKLNKGHFALGGDPETSQEKRERKFPVGVVRRGSFQVQNE